MVVNEANLLFFVGTAVSFLAALASVVLARLISLIHSDGTLDGKSVLANILADVVFVCA